MGEVLPERDGSGHGVVAVDDGEDPLDELVDVQDLLKVLLTLLRHLQHAQAQEVVPAGARENTFSCQVDIPFVHSRAKSMTSQLP